MVEISFVIPAYNAEKYINRCIAQLLQIRNIEIEVIVVNDGSTDHTLQCIEAISDPRMVIISQENKGVSVARNVGMSQAKGAYIFFVDADDCVLSDKFENYVSHLSLDADLYMFSYQTILNNGHKTKAVLPLPNGIYGDVSAKELSLRLYDIKFSKNYEATYFGGKIYQYLFRRSFLIDNQIFFLKDIHFAEDCIFCFQCFQRARTIQVDNVCLYEYYVYDGSASHTYRPNLWKELVTSYELADNYSGGKLKHKNDIFFFYGNEVIRRIVLNMRLSEHRRAIKKIDEMLENEEFQRSINCLSFSKWTLRERILQILYRKKAVRLTYIFHLVIVRLRMLKMKI